MAAAHRRLPRRQWDLPETANKPSSSPSSPTPPTGSSAGSKRTASAPERYSGRDPHRVRDTVRAEFASRQFQILVSTDAGNEGIDLQTAHVLVNWDIPWSLVRLEQRMGRIHRVGQTRDVELYNLVATGTREGDALLRLLENLCAAANELDGKMFDSLSLVAETALSEAGIDDIEKFLQEDYETGNGWGHRRPGGSERSRRTGCGRSMT